MTMQVINIMDKIKKFLLNRFEAADLFRAIKHHDVRRTKRIARKTGTRFEYVNDVESGCPPMCLAAKQGFIDTITVLFHYGLSPHVPDDKCWFPVHYAAQNGQCDVINVLVECGHADVTRSCPVAECPCKKQTALHVAAEFGQYEAVLALLHGGSDVNSRDFQNKTPLQVANDAGHENIVHVINSFVAIHSHSV